MLCKGLCAVCGFHCKAEGGMGNGEDFTIVNHFFLPAIHVGERSGRLFCHVRRSESVVVRKLTVRVGDSDSVGAVGKVDNRLKSTCDFVHSDTGHFLFPLS